MIKRDILTKVTELAEADGMGGVNARYEDGVQVFAHVSVTTTEDDVTQFGITKEQIIHTVTNTPLPEGKYKYNDTYFLLLRQIKNGNEYYQVLKEISV